MNEVEIKHISFKNTGYFSKTICDYIDESATLQPFISEFPSLSSFENQLKNKSSFDISKRKILVDSLLHQYSSIELHEKVKDNINALENPTTYTVTTGHQLSVFTGPLYFIYKIISTINLSDILKQKFPDHHFVPVYWMATEDHDYDEIKSFTFHHKKITWHSDEKGAVGNFSTSNFKEVYDEFSKCIGNSNNAEYLKHLFKKAYLTGSTLSEATRTLVNELFKEKGLVIVDGDDKQLKNEFKHIVKDELVNNTSYNSVLKTNQELEKKYAIQVSPRDINLFYHIKGLRERIIQKSGTYYINNTDISFTTNEILDELAKYPERFSPNVIMRPLYQETILPNLAYIGGGGELAYWFQLKSYFEMVKTPFPLLILRNSVQFIPNSLYQKCEKLDIHFNEVFLNLEELINTKIKQVSEIEIDFTSQKEFLQEQFTKLKEIATKTDKSFIGAVLAQEKKQLNGLDKLEKRLLKAQKRKHNEIVERITFIKSELFPKEGLEERYRNFSELYLELGDSFFEILFNELNPLDANFKVIIY